MAKLKSKTPTAQLEPSLDQASFLRVLDVVEGWDRVRASEDEIDQLSEQLTDANDAAAWQQLLSHANGYATDLRQAAQTQNWEGVEARLLTVLVCGGHAVLRGMRLCLPASLAGVSEAHRVALFLAIVRRRAARIDIDPLPWVRLVVLLRVLAPHAVHEVCRRVKGHVGALYGLAAYLWNRPDAEEELRALLMDMSHLHSRHIHAPSVRRVLQQRQPHQTNPRPPDIVPEIASALANILDRRRLLDDPLDSLVAGLDGRLNIFPKAVGNQATTDVLPKRRYREIPIEISSERKPDTMHIDDLARAANRAASVPPVPTPLDVLINNDTDDERACLIARVAAEVQRLCAQKAKHRVGYEAFTGQATKADLARKYRKDPDTIGRWEKNFVAELRENLSHRKS